MDILSRREGGKVYYYVGSRAFELPELKLLVDAVQASRFITRKKSTQLIRKVEGLGQPLSGAGAAAAGVCSQPGEDGKREHLLQCG